MYSKKDKRCLSERKMKPNYLLKAKAGNGIVTVLAPFNGFPLMVLGASCFVSVSPQDGNVSSFVVKPNRPKEVVAVALIDACHPDKNRNSVCEVFLLSVTKENDIVLVDLDFPFIPLPDKIGQLVHDEKSCTMRLTLGDRGSVESIIQVLGTIEAGKSFNKECEHLVDDKDQFEIKL